MVKYILDFTRLFKNLLKQNAVFSIIRKVWLHNFKLLLGKPHKKKKKSERDIVRNDIGNMIFTLRKYYYNDYVINVICI